MHVPKSAGTSFRRVLADLCPSGLWFNYGSIFSRAEAQPGLVPTGTQIIHGHFLADAFDGLYPNRTLVTWVRDPVERVVSNYEHFLRAPDMRDDCCRAVHQERLDLRGFAALEWMRNETSRYLAGKTVGDFEFVGIAEHFDESLRRFCATFGFRNPARVPRENANPAKASGAYAISQADRDFILECNADDKAWYDDAVRAHGSASPRARSRSA